MQKHKLIWIVATVVALAAVAGGLLYVNRSHLFKGSSNTASNPNQTVDEQSKADAARKKALIEQNKSTPNGQPTDNSTSSQNVSLDVNARQETNGSVTVFTQIKGIGSGSCNLTVTNGSQTYTQTAEVIYQPEYSSCAGFSVPVSKLGAGTWQIGVAVKSDSASTHKTIGFEVK